MVVLVPTGEFRQHRLRALPRAGALGVAVRGQERAQANRVARDRLVAEQFAPLAGAPEHSSNSGGKPGEFGSSG
ncbi:hypothetical protein ACFC6L_31260 [Kitasatospora phosalacinea]|uniref:hypothetical protein n=1 Tax=Kitasatospora phosalacinea TaxID=2065 RepID=UPI0035E3753C